MTRSLLLITGSGRSGTSSLAGSLNYLGLHVPRPHVQANELNPRGFFETAWVVEFHADLLRRAMVRSSDGSPEAVDRVRRVTDATARSRLEQWLQGQPDQLIVIKDNQAVWFLDLWSDVAAATGSEMRLLTSLRHPAEVVGSRDKAWGHGRDALDRQLRESANVAAWLNGSLVVESSGRRYTRAFLRYTDLLTDWRGTLTRAFDQLELPVTVPARSERHILDDWIDSSMRTSQLSWGDLRVPGTLQIYAEDAWVRLGSLVEQPASKSAEQALDGIRASYDDLYLDSCAIALDESRHLQKVAARRASAKVRARQQAGGGPQESLTATSGVQSRLLRLIRRH